MAAFFRSGLGVLPFVCALTACSGGDETNESGSGTGGSLNPSGTGGGGNATGGAGPDGTGGEAPFTGGAGPGSGGAPLVIPTEGLWPTYEEAANSELSTKTLVVLMDFADTDIDTFTPNAESEWARLMFGTNQGEGNHYWYETSGGQFQLLRAEETNGTPNDGLVRVKISSPRPQSGPVLTEDQPWIPEALETLAADVDFAAFDTNGDKLLTNDELTVFFIMDVDPNVLSIADAQANINFSYPIAAAGVTLDKFTRSLAIMSSIGVPMHELGHHILQLNHFSSPTEHCLMGQGSYAPDPEIGNLHNPSYKSSTRPTGLMSQTAVFGGLLEETPISDTTLGVELHSPELGQKRNVITLPVKDGLLFVGNRTKWGYDQSIPFCEGSEGGLFFMEVSQYVRAVNIPGIQRDLAATEHFDGELDFCEYYAHAGHNDTFEYGGWRFENISAAGPTMVLDIVKTGQTPQIDHHKLVYWVNDTTREGYRRKVNKRIDASHTPDMDFAEMINGDTTATRFPVWLDAYYTTGESRNVNTTAVYTSDNPFVSIGIDGFPFTNEGATLETAITIIRYNTAATHAPTANFTVDSNGAVGSFTMSNIPSQ